MRLLCTVFLAFLALLFDFASGGAWAQEGIRVDSGDAVAASAPDADVVELFRLRIVNRVEGVIQASSDGGANWQNIGRVLSPATTVAEGFTAAQYAAPGSVVAVAVHGIRIRVGRDDPTLHDPLVLSIDPVEFGDDAAQDPDRGYGGQVSGSAGILTDIPAGAAIFRELAPRVGSRVYLERADGNLHFLPSRFRPTGEGEALVIIVTASRTGLTTVTFDNRVGGKVTATWVDGATRDLTQVVQPVLGIGRFDGTAYTGVGRINTNHTGVITVSTAPLDHVQVEGEGRERRGGFQISPVWHNARLEEAGAPSVMTLGSDPHGPRKRELEGTAPLFFGEIGLGGDDPNSAIVDVSIDDGPWEPMPALVGNVPDAFSAAGLNRCWKAQKIDRVAVKGVTAFRLRLATWDGERARQAVLAAAARFRVARYAYARTGKMPIVRGVLTINANPTNAQGVAFVRLLVDGEPRGFTNVSPFALTWNTTLIPDDEYTVEADALNADGAVLAVTRRKVFVLNHKPPSATVAAATRPVVGP